ncbi:hypothetical protein Sjap_001205 [Stephania japonica]|uniref:Uncharacterized protein n=1 Tax=Stephania japonica TaxID=461633 RepID=A0AAP0KKF3_9MAGN
MGVFGIVSSREWDSSLSGAGYWNARENNSISDNGTTDIRTEQIAKRLSLRQITDADRQIMDR